MESAPMKHRRSSVEDTIRDRLSELPDGVLVNILSFMPTLDAVRTVLIRRFGNLWTLVHSLHFDPFRHPTSVSFLDFVRNVLFFHLRPTIEKFHLTIGQAHPVIEMWLQFAQIKEVKVLKVKNYYYYYTIPRCVFAGQSLVSLKIIGCIFKHQSPVHMGSLRKLKLVRCSVRDETLQELISGCPSLEKLKLWFPSQLATDLCVTSPSINMIHLIGRGSAKIDCPNLKTLNIHASVDEVGVIDVSSVSEANIHLYGSLTQKSANTLLSLLKRIRNAEILTLSPDTIQHVAYCSLKGLAFPHNKWKRLNLGVWFHETRMQDICNFVRNSPSLEELTICAYEEFQSVKSLDIIDNNLFVQELSSPCLMQLRTVTMYGFGKSYQAQLQLAEFLLKSALNLENYRFVSHQIPISEEQIAFFEEVSSFQRASANVRLVFPDTFLSNRL